MTNFRIGRWLLVALAIVGLAFVTPLVGAHGNDTTGDGAPPHDGTADGWAAWMEAQMTEHMGPGAAEWMESHMGVPVDEMAEHMADDDHVAGDDHVADDDRGTYGQGHC